MGCTAQTLHRARQTATRAVPFVGGSKGRFKMTLLPGQFLCKRFVEGLSVGAGVPKSPDVAFPMAPFARHPGSRDEDDAEIEALPPPGRADLKPGPSLRADS